ncbi:MAG: glycosyltransferase [bacterium]|nr:glycosyltransferase [bacterium]
MNLTFWTFAADGQLPSSFPRVHLAGETLFLAGSEAGDPRALHSNPKNFAACLNEAANRAEHGLVVFLPPDLLELPAHWKTLLSSAAAQNETGVFFYGDYFLRETSGDALQTVRRDIGDVTEREDWGPLWAVRAEWLLAIGGLDEQNPRAAFYDLLLKSWRKRVHVGGALAVIPAPIRDTEADQTKQKLFFPGRGKLGGFSYLFMDPEEEKQTETVFYNFLKRENAWLDGDRTSIPPCPPASGGEPLVSIVTGVFNRADFIGEAIESVQAQTLADWEYIIVDNGSTDRTREIVREYAAHDSRIRLIENNVNIIAVSLNIAVRAARGRFIAQLDSDDVYLPHTLEKMTTALLDHPTWGVAIGYYELMDELGRVLPEFGVIKHLEYNRNNILRVDGAGAPRVWQRSAILEFGGFDEPDFGVYGEDYDLVLKCGEKYEVGRVHEICYRYRRHSGNTDILREPELKIRNKTLARLRAIERRKAMNSSV